MEREEIIRAVSVATGFKVNTFISEKEAQSLTKLKNYGKVSSPDQGI